MQNDSSVSISGLEFNQSSLSLDDYKQQLLAAIASMRIAVDSLDGFDGPSLDSLTAEQTNEIRDTFVNFQASLQKGFPALKGVRKHLFALQPSV